MNTTSCVVVVGYNGSRVHDIQKLRDLCKSLYNARLILLVEQIQPHDDQVADHVCSTSFNEKDVATSLELVVGCLNVDRWKLIGVLPFSDRGVLLGAALASHFGLPGITRAEARAGLDKQIFRHLEATAETSPEDYRRVYSERVESLPQLRKRVVELGGKAFIKPACEGASRGCRVIHQPSECDEAWQALKPYREGGIVLEELIQDAREYSWDCVAGSTWVTEKTTTEGAYRAEIQQVVPAPLPADVHSRLMAAGRHMADLVSGSNGAWHNEVFHRADQLTSAVETNMRPGGMHIWDLAKRAFVDFNPWERWVRWAVEGQIEHHEPVPRGYCGIRLLRARTGGILRSTPDIEAVAQALNIEVVEATFGKRVGDSVSALVKDNFSFIGHIVLFNEHYGQLSNDLLRLAEAVESRVGISSLAPPVRVTGQVMG
ncbi:acetyl-CoA carboxylase biotin carboxylase subunit family protein [Pseudomonas sp. C2B4]|uniref:ATP-grasp domain-containing protein n=1 Tax=Pseudomonas sp. C2B4 TaxID=2735270 RepID=UPI001586B392|nr:biotin carboxylase [Pseudomonas sp. C2B4]NUU36240.1 biotin carboxylase [Pseudomonas sp. C2B4]